MQLCGSAPLHSIWWSIKPITHFKKSWSSHTDTYAQTQSSTHMVVGCLMEVWWCFQGHFAEREWVRWGGIAESVRELTQRVHDYFSMFLRGHVFVLVGTKKRQEQLAVLKEKAFYKPAA